MRALFDFQKCLLLFLLFCFLSAIILCTYSSLNKFTRRSPQNTWTTTKKEIKYKSNHTILEQRTNITTVLSRAAKEQPHHLIINLVMTLLCDIMFDDSAHGNFFSSVVRKRIPHDTTKRKQRTDVAYLPYILVVVVVTHILLFHHLRRFRSHHSDRNACARVALVNVVTLWITVSSMRCPFPVSVCM